MWYNEDNAYKIIKQGAVVSKQWACAQILRGQGISLLAWIFTYFVLLSPIYHDDTDLAFSLSFMTEYQGNT